MSESIAESYPELMHYTTAAGLTGIVTSGCLWATHAAFLNDSQEIHHFIDGPFREVLLAEVLRLHIEHAAEKSQDQLLAQEIAPRSPAGFLERWRASIVKNLNFFVFSMSRPTTEIVAAHGLLSQWRGYGHDGGYAIVLDTQDLNQLLQAEEKFNLCPTFMKKVIYTHEANMDDPIAAQDTGAMDAIVKGIAMMLRGARGDELIELSDAITTLPVRYKHWGFEEECEVRIVALLPRKDVANFYAEYHGDKRQPKVPKAFIRGGVPVPYLELFADRPGGSRHLPIKRVIVGPHRDQTLRIDAVQRLLAANGYVDVAVHGSAIPYLGR